MPTLKLGSTTALTESSGALTVNVANPTITLGSNATFPDMSNCTFPAGHVIQTTWSLFAGSTAFNDNHNNTQSATTGDYGVDMTSVNITLSAGSDVVLFGMAEYQRLSATTGSVIQLFRIFRSTTLLASNETKFNTAEDSDKGVQSLIWVDVNPGAGTKTYYLNMNNPSNNMQCNHAHIICMEVV